ncbi:unnamed protein product [Clavelina lepadiformis]|uniref:Tryptophan synthase beta chain-like PALP domain-containing protein n=1 Tax=Clavelina lepadiformis TaxID=159417 RepID=A0ABP0H1D3_CLALP
MFMTCRNHFLMIIKNQSVFHHHTCSYQVPTWASHLKNIPRKRIKLAMLPTPVQKWNIKGIPDGIEVFVKRDDMTGSTLSNKVRKLEFLLADAVTQGCGSVITCGGLQSNHCRATAVAARELELDCHLFLRANETNVNFLDSAGNLLPSLLCNSHIYLIPKFSKYKVDIAPKQELLASQIKKKSGKSAYCIPVGGSSGVGVFGYIEAWEELITRQNVMKKYDDIVVACGSGGTIAGLAIGNYLTGEKLKVHGITVCDNKDYFHSHVNEMLDTLGITETRSQNIVDIIDGYKGAGYGQSTFEDHEFYKSIAHDTGIICDPVYTGKALKGMLTELHNNKNRFQGSRILFIHTGGIFSLYDGRITSQLKNIWLKNTYRWRQNAAEPEKI